VARTALPAGVAAASEQAIRQLAFRDYLRSIMVLLSNPNTRQQKTAGLMAG